MRWSWEHLVLTWTSSAKDVTQVVSFFPFCASFLLSIFSSNFIFIPSLFLTYTISVVSFFLLSLDLGSAFPPFPPLLQPLGSIRSSKYFFGINVSGAIYGSQTNKQKRLTQCGQADRFFWKSQLLSLLSPCQPLHTLHPCPSGWLPSYRLLCLTFIAKSLEVSLEFYKGTLPHVTRQPLHWSICMDINTFSASEELADEINHEKIYKKVLNFVQII